MLHAGGHSLPWFRVDCDVVDHPKVLALATAWGVSEAEAGWFVVRLWSWTMRYAPQGRLSPGMETALVRLAPGAETARGRRADVHLDAAEVVRGLVSAGWLDDLGAEGLEVHDWVEHNGAAVAKAQKDAERKRAARARRGDGAETARAGRGDGARTARVRDETRRDETKKKMAPAARAPRESDLLCEDFFEAVGEKYLWAGAKDGAALARLLKAHPLGAIRERWRRGLRETGWLQVRTVAQLAQKWNDLAPAQPVSRATTRDVATCAACGVAQLAGIGGTPEVPVCFECMEAARGDLDDAGLFDSRALGAWAAARRAAS